MSSDQKIVLHYKPIWMALFGVLILFGLGLGYNTFFLLDRLNYFTLFNSLACIFLGVYCLIFHYAKIHDGKVKRMDSLKKSLYLNQLTEVTKSNGVYLLKAGTEEVAINNRMITKISEREFVNILAKYGYEFD